MRQAPAAVVAEVLDHAGQRPVEVAGQDQPGANRVAVAALVLSAKQMIQRAREYAAAPSRTGCPAGEDSGLFGVTVGVIGASHVGRAVLERLRSLDVRALVTDPYLDPEQAAGLGAEPVALDELCRLSDVVTVHAPELPETHHLLGAAELALLRRGAAVINTARGALVDTEALAEECAKGRLSAILDGRTPSRCPLATPC